MAGIMGGVVGAGMESSEEESESRPGRSLWTKAARAARGQSRQGRHGRRRNRPHEVPDRQAIRERPGASAGTPRPVSLALGLRFATRRNATQRDPKPSVDQGRGRPSSVTWHLPVALKDPALSRSSFDGTPTGRRKKGKQHERPQVPAPPGWVQFFKGTARRKYALHPEVNGGIPRENVSDGFFSPFPPPGRTTIWAYPTEAGPYTRQRGPLHHFPVCVLRPFYLHHNSHQEPCSPQVFHKGLGAIASPVLTLPTRA